MALVSVNLVDTFDEWRLKTNSLGSNTGDLATLATTDKSSIVAAINEIHQDDSDDMENLIDDTTPQLGGHLDIQAFNITGTGSIAGTITGVTQSALDNSTKLATTEYTDYAISQIDTVVGGVFTGTVGNIQVPDNAITSNMIGPGVIVAQDIASNAVDGTHIAMGSDVRGDTLYYDGTNYVRLPKGTSGHILTQGANDPQWAAPAAVNTDLINDTTPQMGGNLDLNTNDIIGSGNINITGTITATATTQSAGDNSNKLATTEYVDSATSGGSGGGASEGFAVGMAIALG